MAKTTPKNHMAKMRNTINRKVKDGHAAFDLMLENPSSVPYWIPTGSTVLDAQIVKGMGWAGIPGGKITEMPGLPSTGKSFLAAVIIANAQKMGITPVYFDSENALDTRFFELAGVDLENVLYIQARSVEFVFCSIDDLMVSCPGRTLFVWASLANTASESDLKGDYDPGSSIAVTARIISKGLKKLTIPLGNSECAFLVLNQLKSNIGGDPTEPLVSTGGKGFDFCASLRIFLTRYRAKKNDVFDDNGYKIGSHVKAKLHKSRYGTEGRECQFKILWGGDDVRVQDEESWLGAIKASKYFETKGSWFWVYMVDGDDNLTEENAVKFQTATFVNKLNSNPEFKKRVLEIIQVKLVDKFAKREGNAADFYREPEGEEEEALALAQKSKSRRKKRGK